MDWLFPPEEGDSNYAWIIDKDHLATRPDDRDDKGTMGPRNAPQDMLDQLNSDPKAGRQFKIYDDDGELYYTGRILGVVLDDTIYRDGTPEGERADFGPLWDFGTPNAGAVEIRYRNEAGEWQTL